MKKCPNGHPVGDKVKFCPKCGVEIVAEGPMICAKCGNERKGSEKFCPKCGTPYDHISTIFTATTDVGQEEPSKKSISKKKVLIAAVVVMVVLAGGALWYLNFGDRVNSDIGKDNVVLDSISIESVSDASENINQREQIVIRLEEIFDDVEKGNVQSCDDRYFSSDFKRIYKEVEDIDNRINQGNVGFWDLDFWYQSRDYESLTVNINNIYDVNDQGAKANVIFNYTFPSIYEAMPESKSVLVDVIFENGKWVIDDIYGYRKLMEEYIEEYKNYQPSPPQNNTDWLQGHWVYEQGSYKGHFIIEGDKIIQYSSMNPGREESTFRIENGEIKARLIDGVDLVVPIDFVNKRIDYGDGCWMHKVND